MVLLPLSCTFSTTLFLGNLFDSKRKVLRFFPENPQNPWRDHHPNFFRYVFIISQLLQVMNVSMNRQILRNHQEATARQTEPKPDEQWGTQTKYVSSSAEQRRQPESHRIPLVFIPLRAFHRNTFILGTVSFSKVYPLSNWSTDGCCLACLQSSKCLSLLLSSYPDRTEYKPLLVRMCPANLFIYVTDK